MLKQLLFLSLLMVLSLSAFGQQLLILNRMDTKDRTQKQEVKGVEFLAYPLTSEIIDLRDFKKHFPEVPELDYVKLQLPDMTAHKDSTVLLGFLKEGLGDSGALVILPVGDYDSDRPVIYVDKTMDRSYLNDDPPIQLSPSRRKAQVVLDDLGKQNSQREFFIYIPKSNAVSAEKQAIREQNREDRKAGKSGIPKDRFSIGLHILFGSSKLQYEYMNLDYGFPTWYEVYGTEKGLGANLTYNFPRFRIGVEANYQNLSFWSSYKFIRYDEEREVVNPTTGAVTQQDNILVLRNRDILPKHRLQWSLLAAYRIHLTKTMELQPRVTGGWFTYLPAKYTPERSSPEVWHSLTSTPFVEAGLDFDFKVAPDQAFTIGLSVLDTDFRPSGYFESTPHTDLETNWQAWRMSLGYRVGLK